jgi:hypothetical protein
VAAWLLDAFQTRHFVLPKCKEGDLITKSALRALLAGGIVSTNYVKASQTYAKNVTGFASAVIFSEIFEDRENY